MPTTEEVQTDVETEVKLKSFTCETCGETRDLMAFYDDEHVVWIGKDLSIIVDHGEAGA